ncbi:MULTISPECIES: hypothetical protein [Lysinibacillus]|uniref:hypothetical protein n=1 Tax=Lysinibacillus TaxID=400634 RepID=UPI00214B907B|nr:MULTISPECIES: hypothetical protein [Lysinibacillus]UUV25890.1 hypothetical protein NP781_04540 [Lysinibacillus sp. FN11]UYB48763.1 hypothetical protein OCI51_07330 [Lysinibacillus capsici]
MNKYKIELIAQSFSFYYESTEMVHADNLLEAEKKAIKQFSERMGIDKYLIRVV